MAAAVQPLLELVLPYPDKALNPNARSDWHTLANEKAKYKNACYLLARNARQLSKETFPLKAPVTVLITFVMADHKRRDWDNALSSFKAGLDGIVEAGVLADDSMSEIRIGLEMEYGKQASVRVRLQGA